MTTQLASHFLFGDDTMVINGLEMRDQETISYFKDLELSEIEEKFKNIIKLGVVVTKTVGTAEKLDYIEKEFNKLDSKFENNLDGVLTDLRTECETPLYNLIKEVKSGIDEMKEQLSINKGVELSRQSTTLKGFDFQDYCEDILSNLARVHGDSLENTSTRVGRITRSKKGDFVLTLGNEVGKKCVIELKDVYKRFSVDDILNELEEAKKNREADYAIFVTRYVESLPKSTRWFAEFNGHNLVCALGNKQNDSTLHEEILCISYKWAKSKLLLDSYKEKKIDCVFINQQVKAVFSRLNVFDTILTQYGNIKRSNEEIKKSIESIREEIEEELNKIINSLESK